MTNYKLVLSCLCVLIVIVHGQDIHEGENPLDKEVFDLFRRKLIATDDELQLLQNVIVLRYSGRVKAADSIMQNLDRLVPDKRITGYRILFDEMMKAKNLYSTFTLSLLTRINRDMEDHAVSDIKRIDLFYMLENMPRMIKEFPFDGGLYLENSMGKDMLATGDFLLDKTRRATVAWKSTCQQDECVWDLQPVPGKSYFRLSSRKFKELVAMDDTFNAVTVKVDGEWLANRWHLMPMAETELWVLRNVHLNKVMCRSSDVFKFNGKDDLDRHGLLGMDLATLSECQWKIMGEIEFNERFGESNEKRE